MSTTATSRFEAIRAAARGGAPSRFEQIRRAAAATPIVPQTVPATAADLIPGGNFYGEGLGGSFADSPYGPTGSPFQGERQNAATALRLMEADRLRSTPAADAVAAGLASGQDQGLGGAMVSAASGGALDALLAAGGTPSTDIARMAAQAGGQGSYPAARTVAGVAGQLAAIASMGPLAPAVMGGIRRQNVMERTGGNEDAAMLAGAVGAASMLNPLGGVGANVAFNAAANPAATAAEELIAVRAGAEPTPEGEFNRQLLIDATVGAGVPALQAGVPGAVRAGVGRWQERRASQAGMRAEGLRRYQEAYREGRNVVPGAEPTRDLVVDAPPVDGAAPSRLADAPDAPPLIAPPSDGISPYLVPTIYPEVAQGLTDVGTPKVPTADVDDPATMTLGALRAEARRLGVLDGGPRNRSAMAERVKAARLVTETPTNPAEAVGFGDSDTRATQNVAQETGDTAPPEVAARTPIERAPNGPSLQEEGRQEGLLIGSAPETVTGAGEQPAPGIRATQNVAQPRQFTKADIERRLVDAHQSMGFERPETDETAIISRKFTFPNRLPAEVRDIVESYPETRAVFRVGRGGGEDYAAAVGWERVAAEARDLGGADVRRAKEFFVSEPSINPEATFLATLHDNLPKSGAKKMQSVDPKTLPEGTRFKINGEEFRVELDGSGEGRYKVLKDGDTYPDTPVDALDAIPVDRGSLESPGAKPRKTWQEKKREKAAAAVVKPEPVAAKPEPVAEAKPAAVDTLPDIIKATPDEISLELATRAHSGTSFSPEKRGLQRQQEYAAMFNRVRDSLAPLAKTPEQVAALNAALGDYKRGLLERYNAYLNSNTRIVSTMIAGGSNFPARRMEKYNQWSQNRLTELLEFQEKAEGRIRHKVFPEQSKVISSDNPNAPELLAKKIANAERLQEAMKAGNKIIRDKSLSDQQKIEKMTALGLSEANARAALKPDFANRVGFPDYAMKNNLAEIKRLKGRAAQLETRRASDAREATFEGGKIVENKDANRVQILFDGKPDEATRAKLKARGFRWAPSEGAWQRQATESAWSAAMEATGAADRGKVKTEADQMAAMRKQAEQFKGQNPGVMLLNRVGDFYEASGDDAARVSKTLGVTLQTRADGTQSAGIPMHTLDRSLQKLIAAGHRVAIMEAKDAGVSSEVKATDTLDAIRRAADNWEAKARDSIKKRQLPRGRNTGGTTLPADLIDYATIAAARVVKAGVTGTRAIRDVVDRLLAEDGKAGVIDPAPIVRAVKSLAKGSREGGQYTPEAFERAMGAMQERMAPKAPPVKRTVNEATGVSSVEAATVKPSEALSAGMRKAKRAADQAWREATKVSRAEGRANLEALRLKMRADFKAKRMDHEAARAEAVKIAEGLPLRERGKLVRAITKATTPRRVLRLIEQAGRLLDAHEGRDQVRQLAKAVARKQLIKLDEETRLKVARAALGLPETAAVSMNIAQMRAAIKDASSLLLEAMGSKDSGAVSVARIQATDRTRKVVEVIHQFKRQNRVILAGKIADATRLRTELQGDVAKAKAPAFLRDREGSAAEPRRTPWLRRAIRTQLTNESVAMTIDGKYGGGGVAHRVLVENLWRGESAMNGQMRDFTQALDRIAKKHGMGSLGEAMSRVSGSLGRSTQQKIPVRLGNIREITLGQAMDLVAMDPATRAKVEAGNAISFATRPNERVVIDAADFKAIEDALTPQQKAMIRDVKALIESDLQPDLFAALRQIKGWEPERVLDYWPSARNRRLTEGRTDAYAGWSGVVDQHLEDAGFTQNRTGGDTPFLVRDFLNTAIDHARSTAAIIHLAEPIRSAEMVMLDPSTRTAMATKFGDDVPKRVEEMLREISSLGRYQPQSTAGKAVLGLTRNVSRALTSINYRSWARQLGGVATLATEMPLSAYRAGLAGAFGKGVFEDMTEASPFLWNRYAESPSMMLSGMGQIGDTGAAATAGKTLAAAGRSWRRGRVLEGSGVAMKALDAVRIASFFDSIAARVAWSGFKAEADRVLPNASPAERRAWAADQTEQVIRRTQNTFSVLDSSKFAQMARREPVLAPLAMFTGDSNKAFNLLYQAAGRGKKDFGKVAATRAINAAWGAAITGGAPLTLYLIASALSGNDAGRERQKDRAVQRAGSQFVREIAGTALFGDKLVDLVAGALEGFNGRDPLETPAGGQIAQVVTGIGQIATGVLGRMDEDPERAEAASKRFAQGVERTILGTTTAFGLPIAPIVGDIKTARRAIRATVAEDLIDERRQLRRVPEDQRTDSQMERLAELDGWFTSHNELRRQIKELRDAGEDADAAALERELEPLAMEYKTQSARLATR